MKKDEGNSPTISHPPKEETIKEEFLSHPNVFNRFALSSGYQTAKRQQSNNRKAHTHESVDAK